MLIFWGRELETEEEAAIKEQEPLPLELIIGWKKPPPRRSAGPPNQITFAASISKDWESPNNCIIKAFSRKKRQDI